MNPVSLNNGEAKHQLKRPREEDSAMGPSSLEEEIVIKIVSAFYGPCEGQRVGASSTVGDLSNEESAKVPYTRDVTPILRALLQLQESKQQQQQQQQSTSTNNGITSNSPKGVLVSPNAKRHPQGHEEEEEDPHMVRLRAIAGGTGGMKRTSIPIQALHDGWNSMNIVFGDACPGTSKKLYIHYVIFHTQKQQQQQQQQPSGSAKGSLVSSEKQASALSSEVHHVSFSEYDPVILRRRLTFYQDEMRLQQATARVLAKKSTLAKTLFKTSSDDKRNDSSSSQSGDVGAEEFVDDDEQTLLIAQRMGRSQSISDFAKLTVDEAEAGGNNNIDSTGNRTAVAPPSSPARRLRSATFEIVLPMILSFLQIHERVQCRLVCRLWRNIVRDWGVASIIDSTDPTVQHAFTRPFLRGILTHSYSSLHSLRLSDFHELTPEDLHPSLPFLKKLRVLDISRCRQLNDETMHLLANHVSSTLEVLYIKGLAKVSDTGVSSICKSCRKLTVLDVSNLALSDETGVLIGGLTKLRALYMRDNFRLTNKSIDAITANCTKLNQLVLWGCVKLQHLTFHEMPNHNAHAFTSGRLVSLSLWGCYSLNDDVAAALGVMTQLRSLIVSECHRLTDQFAIGIAQNLPQLNFLYMRYCKRLTDSGVNAIASAMENLYSLDLSFCTKITSSSICNLLESRHETLSELRLMECSQLQIVPDPDDDDEVIRRQQSITRGGRDGQSILKSLKSPTGSLYGRADSSQESNLSILDVRCCGGQPSREVGYPGSGPFVRGMTSLKFEQRTPGFFSRPARWNATVEDCLLKQLAFDNDKRCKF